MVFGEPWCHSVAAQYAQRATTCFILSLPKYFTLDRGFNCYLQYVWWWGGRSKKYKVCWQHTKSRDCNCSFCRKLLVSLLLHPTSKQTLLSLHQKLKNKEKQRGPFFLVFTVESIISLEAGVIPQLNDYKMLLSIYLVYSGSPRSHGLLRPTEISGRSPTVSK